MSRNQNSYFAINPTTHIQRSRMDLSHSVDTTFNAGYVIPLEWMEILPGSTLKVDVGMLARMQTLLSPIFGNVYLDLYHFFVPNRLIWEHWKEFMGEESQPWYDTPQYSVPQISFDIGKRTNNAVGEGTVADYLGLPMPPASGSTTKMTEISHLPFRAYVLIWNSWFRNENLQNLATFNDSDSGVTMDKTSSAFYGGALLPANKFRDYFTSCLPQPQRGPSVTIGVGDSAPVFTRSTDHTRDVLKHGQTQVTPLHWTHSVDSASYSGSYVKLEGRVDSADKLTTFSFPSSDTVSGTVSSAPSNLYADISNATGISINELRYAFAMQQFYEASARSGNRYIEMLDAMFSTNPGDLMLHRPEYLGGSRLNVNISQVLSNSDTVNGNVGVPLGDVGAYSLTTGRDNGFVKSFSEHGIYLCCCVARYDHSYQNGIDRMWLRKDKFDYYFPIFKNIGEQPVYLKQLYVDQNVGENTVFGYQESWGEYRYRNNICTGEMRSGITNTLNYWNLADYYTSAPSLSDTWIKEDGAVLDRTLAVSSQISNQFLANLWFHIEATLPMPMFSVPGLDKL